MLMDVFRNKAYVKRVREFIEMNKATSREISERTAKIIAHGGLEYTHDLPSTYPDNQWVPYYIVNDMLKVLEEN